MSCGVGHRCGLDPVWLLWLWHRPVAAALIRPLAWEPPYAKDEALEKTKKKKKISKVDKVIETESRIEVSRGLEEGRRGSMGIVSVFQMKMF